MKTIFAVMISACVIFYMGVKVGTDCTPCNDYCDAYQELSVDDILDKY